MRLIFLQIFLLTIGTVYSQVDCNKYPDDYIPKELTDALTYLDCTWSDKDKEEFKTKDESDAVTELHMGTGLGIRNNWELWKRKNSLYRSFKSKGIFHPDDISSIILTSFHRQLNNKDIDLDNQIKYYQNYWKQAELENRKAADEQKLKDQQEFDKYKIGDTVKMRFTQGNCEKCLLLYKIQNEVPPWQENGKSCVVVGIVKNKRIENKYNFILMIAPTDICGEKMAYHGDGEKDNLMIGKVFNYNIRFYNIARD